MTTTYGRYLGRVGALAVALGVGGAVATTPGVAWADETSSSASDGTSASQSIASTPSATSPSSEPATDRPGAAAEEPGTSPTPLSPDTNDTDAVVRSSGGAHTADIDDLDAAIDATEDAAESGDETETAELEPAIATDDVTPRSRSKTQRIVPSPAPAPTKESVGSDSDTTHVASLVTTGRQLVPPERFASTHAAPTAELTTPSRAAVATTPTPAPQPATTPSAAPSSVLTVAASLLNAALAPLFDALPVAPPNSPLLWTVLAWVRRQVDGLLDSPAASTVARTTQIEQPTVEAAAAAEADSPTAGDAVVSPAAVPSDLERTVVASGLDSPTDFAFLPDGRILITQQNGTIRLVKSDELQANPLMLLPTYYAGERGLLGVAVDPNFEDNGYIYVSYTAPTNHARLSRFTVTGDTAALNSELVLLESAQDSGNFHQGGEVAFGPDGKIYWGIGDNVYGPNAQDLATLHGKILRINPDGTVPTDNPFVDTPGALPQIYAYGLRNPFRFTFTPNGKLMVADVGSVTWEELDIITPGANYGWPFAEGTCAGCAYVNPIYSYAHSLPFGSGAISSVVVYTDDALGAEHQNKVFIADYSLGWMKELTFDSDYSSFISEKMFDPQAGATVKLLQGPDGGLYQLTIYPGVLSRIEPSGGNRAPTAVITATPSNGLAPLQVSFSAAGSSDPDPGTTLTYAWDFGDGTTSTAVTASNTYTANGTYVVTLTVSDGAKTGQATQTITVGSTAPTVQILTPVNDSPYSAGDTISFSGTASDAQDGALPNSAYVWRVDFHHADHIHPFAQDIVGPSGSVVIPRDPNNVADTFYRISLTVTDSSGLSTTQFVDVKPRLVTLTFGANNPEATYTIDGIPHTGPYTETAVVGVQRVLGAPSPQFPSDGQVEFSYWSDGGAQTHTIITPGVNTAYTATFDFVLDHADPWQVLGKIYDNEVANFQRLGNAFSAPGGITAVPAALASAVVDIVTTDAARTFGVAQAIGSHIVPILSTVFNAPVGLGGTLLDRGGALWNYISVLDPLGLYEQGQLAWVVLQGEFNHQINEIEDAIGRMTDDILASLSVSLPAAGAQPL